MAGHPVEGTDPQFARALIGSRVPAAAISMDGRTMPLFVAAGRVPAVAAELDRIAFHPAHVAAELTEGTALLDRAFARRVSTLCCHGDLPLRCRSFRSKGKATIPFVARPSGRLPLPGVRVGSSRAPPR